MKRITALVGSFCLLALFSCKKDVVTPVTDSPKSIENHAITMATTVLQDTVPPSNAVNVKTYGATGNGTTDDTKALQNAINAQNVLVLNGGTYIINTTLTLRSGVSIYGINGATIKSGSAMSGKLLSAGTYMLANGTSKASIVNLNFAPGSKAFSLGVWSDACIYIGNSVSTTVKYNRFNFSQPYAATGMEGVWVSGTGSKGTYIGHNVFNTVGIVYAEAGSSGAITVGNTVNNSHSNALCSYGNSTTYCTGNQVLNNTINNAGYNGINDWGTTNGTQIIANTINGSGKSPSQGSDGEGIQAVGVNTRVSLNSIKDAQAEYIEVASTNKQIDSNVIVDTKGLAEGIVINCVGAPQPNAKSTVASIIHNNITGCSSAIEIIGNYSPNVNLVNNTITNPFSMGINLSSNASSYNVTASGNVINMTTKNPGTGNRRGISSYASPLAAGQKFAITNNTITYGTGAAGAAHGEVALLTYTNNVNITGNKINSNNIKTGNNYIVALSSGGNKFTGYTIQNNAFTGSLIYDFSGFISAIVSGNIL
jgi:Pectate lyase superfamily protein